MPVPIPELMSWLQLYENETATDPQGYGNGIVCLVSSQGVHE
jgi:hypothetical protein